MNNFFCTVGHQLSTKIPHTKNSLLKGDVTVNPEKVSFSFLPIWPQKLVKAMGKFKTSKSFGLDLISSYFLKIGMPILASPLSQLFNLSMSPGLFPNGWKIARVAPIHKTGPTISRIIVRSQFCLLFHVCSKDLFLTCIPFLTMTNFFIRSSQDSECYTQF